MALTPRTLLYVSRPPCHFPFFLFLSAPRPRKSSVRFGAIGQFITSIPSHLLLILLNVDSPVNRGQAHNPFGKRRSLQSIASDNSADVDTHLGSSSSPSPVSTRITLPVEFPALHPSVSPPASLVSLSPRAIPLPSPSPDEVAESNSVN